jgi:hypothetical protein
MYRPISLGRNCTAAYQIRKRYSYETNFFDWLITTTLDKVNLLLTRSIKDILNVNNLIVSDINESSNSHYAIIFKELNNLESRHDCSKSIKQYTIDRDFIDKYRRRYYRLIVSIKQDKLIFIQNIKEIHITTEKHINDFFETIDKLSENTIHKLLIVVYNTDAHAYFQNMNILYKDRFYVLNIGKVDSTIQPEWTENHFDWDSVFTLISTI